MWAMPLSSTLIAGPPRARRMLTEIDGGGKPVGGHFDPPMVPPWKGGTFKSGPPSLPRVSINGRYTIPQPTSETNGKQKTENRKCKTGRIDPFSVFRFRFPVFHCTFRRTFRENRHALPRRGLGGGLLLFPLRDVRIPQISGIT